MLSQAHKYLSNYKCECHRIIKCNCPKKADASEVFMENINDIAGSLSEVMIICGIHRAKARASGEVVINAFLHYDEIRHRIDTVPHKRFCKEDLMLLLGKKCLMSRLEAQMAYSIIKRAFKAFYHGTDVGGIRNPILEAQLIHTQECFWMHAASRTAQIFASYEGLFTSAQKYYESKILNIYKELYERLKKRSDPVVLAVCECPDCSKKTVKKVSLHLNVKEEPNKDEHQDDDEEYANRRRSSDAAGRSSCLAEPDKKHEKHDCKNLDTHVNNSKISLHLPHCYKCNSPQLVCECEVQVDSGVLSTECSQGPFVCRWIRDTEEEKIDPCILIPEDHQCPVDCYEISYECDPECDCTCEDCECPSNDSSSIIEDYDYTDKMSHTLEDVNGETEPSDWQPIPIDMTPMELREQNPKYGCCRTAPLTPVQKPEIWVNPNNERLTSKKAMSQRSSNKSSLSSGIEKNSSGLLGKSKSSSSSKKSKLKSKLHSKVETKAAPNLDEIKSIVTGLI